MPITFSKDIVAFNINNKSPVAGFNHDTTFSSQKVKFDKPIVAYPGQKVTNPYP